MSAFDHDSDVTASSSFRRVCLIAPHFNVARSRLV